jgi:LAO/AO transport system kinase
VVGLTGSPGVGKSTSTAVMVSALRKDGKRVGVLAVDPSSPFSGGALLGDRVRMQDHATDNAVFIRSMASRGQLGGLSAAVPQALRVLDAAGCDVILVETVGVGQAEVDVMIAAQTVVVVSMPGTGDEVQAIKAGLLEIADIHVVNKYDQPGAHKTYADLRDMQRLAPHQPGTWRVPVEKAIGITGEGVAELIERFSDHRQWLATSGEIERREKRNIATRIRWIAEELVLDRLRPGRPEFDRAVDDVFARRGDVVAVARRLLAQP